MRGTVARGERGLLDQYLVRWALTPDGDPIVTRSSQLLPVRWRGQKAMLKLALADQEKAGGALMAWWNGHGAAPVLVHDAHAVLLARAQGTSSLATMARTGQDEAATRIICGVIAKLHAPRAVRPPELVPLGVWFRELDAAASSHGGIFAVAATVARDLLSDPRDVAVLHGDMHHNNILDFTALGWCAIDPKGLLGERAFDYANLFRNPDGEVATRPGRFDRQIALVAEAAALDRGRLLRWILAVMALSASWHIADDELPETTLTVAGLAAAAIAA